MKISIIVPAYKEAGNIEDTVKRIEALKIPDSEIIVVDDGSPDDTFKNAKKTSASVFRLPKNKGKGAAFREGIAKAKGSIIAQIDADCQFLPEELGKLMKPIEEGRCDITFGSRFTKGSKLKEGSITRKNYIANKIDSFLASVFAFRKITDVQAGFKAFKADVIREIDFQSNGFGYEPEIAIIAARKGFKVIDVPITYEKRVAGRSAIKLLSHGISISLMMLRARFRRLK